MNSSVFTKHAQPSSSLFYFWWCCRNAIRVCLPPVVHPPLSLYQARCHRRCKTTCRYMYTHVHGNLQHLSLSLYLSHAKPMIDATQTKDCILICMQSMYIYLYKHTRKFATSLSISLKRGANHGATRNGLHIYIHKYIYIYIHVHMQSLKRDANHYAIHKSLVSCIPPRPRLHSTLKVFGSEARGAK